MTPLEFANKYLELQVYMYPLEASGEASAPAKPGAAAKPGYVPTAGWKTLRVGKYRLGHSAWPTIFWPDIEPHFKKAVKVKVKTISGAIEETELTAHQARKHFQYPFTGKGSPEQVQVALQLLYRFHKAVFPPETAVQKDFVGLDCNGFVGNYIQRVVKNQDWLKADNEKDPGPTTYISGLIEGQGKQNQIADVKSMSSGDIYLLGYCEESGLVKDPSKKTPTSYGHVMITNPGTFKVLPKGFEIGVVESCGGAGLRYQLYTIDKITKAANGTVFHALRGSSGALNVRIARLAC